MDGICYSCCDPILRPTFDFLNRERQANNPFAILSIIASILGLILFFWVNITFTTEQLNKTASFYVLWYLVGLCALLFLSHKFRRTQPEIEIIRNREFESDRLTVGEENL
jgi:hypothetical protein